MHTLLRKIRKSLIESGSTRKYALYAIGEIALVVIGILIALQINNWNVTRQLRNVEKGALVQIRTNLNEEINYYKRNIERGAEIKTYLLDNLSGSYDSVDLEAFPEQMLAQFYWHVDFNSGYLELVSSNTLSIIRNDEIRNEIVRFYGKHYDLMKTLAIEHREFVTTQIDKFVLENLPVNVERKTRSESMIEILDKTNFKSVLSHQIYYMDRFGVLHNDAIEKAKSIDALIDSYLN